jgi:phosphatidate cytidylyltransferase
VLRLRVLTAAIGTPLVVLSVILGPYPFGIFLAIVAGSCTFELCRMYPEPKRSASLALVATVWSVVLATVRLVPVTQTWFSLWITAPVVGSLLVLLISSSSRVAYTQWSWMMAGALYVGLLLGHWGGVYLMPAGRDLVLFGLFTTFLYDSFAFFTGRAIGRHKLAPHLSSGKTWEGAVGGLLVAIVGGLVIRYTFIIVSGTFPFSAVVTIVGALCVTVAAQLGDLVESALKRGAGVKDAGGILPGHGGMLDRFDSVLFVGPMLYYFASWVIA